MGDPMPMATEAERALFDRGERIARHRFTPEEGLGPPFNVTACTSCHEQPEAGGASPRYRNFFLMANRLPDGSLNLLGKSGVHNQFRSDPPSRGSTPEDADVVATRNTIPFFGVGALAEIPEEHIRRRADPNDKDGDGISGEINSDRGFVGRFGRKAQTASLVNFVRGPMFNHAGITTDPLPNARKAELPVPSDVSSERLNDSTTTRRSGLEGVDELDDVEACPTCQAAAPSSPLTDDDGVPDPEMSEDQLFDLVSWVMLLAAPEPEPLDETTRRGKKMFEQIGCADCHVPTLEGPHGEVPAYTDLLIHDMGPKLADDIRQGEASGSEFRTQPLWGVVAMEPYLHDGRADTLDEAIRWHGGEAKASREQYESLDERDREAVLAFLRSLGGRDRDSEGLIPPDDETPKAGELEGPRRPLEGEQKAKFERGRRVFDRDMTIEDGLGPTFNGDSCRACHFEPTPGGAGPTGVNVTREGRLDPETGAFTAPPGGTLLRRFSIDFTKRPKAHSTSNVFELRQPPPLYGLGLIDRIPASQLEQHADPNDENGDGISGRVARLEGDRVGRFGWKGAFPTLEDFVRDALSNEMGLTLTEKSGVVAGRQSDMDGVEDPEFTGQAYRDLLFYCRMLAPPPRRNTSSSTVQTGRDVFEQVGCADCHVPSLETKDGTNVQLYSDLLLHDVSPEGYRGVGEADAKPSEFRTPPLWGISRTGPYMHDGLAGTLEKAITRHAGEAEAVVENYRELSDEKRKALIAFLESL